MFVGIFVKMVFSKENKSLIKNLRQLKSYTASRFLREFNRTGAQIMTILKWTFIQTYNSVK